jgi:hypothetical protein
MTDRLIYTCFNGTRIEYSISSTNCCVFNSHLIKDKETKLNFIRFLRKHITDFDKRSEQSYYREWKTHNLLYKLNLWQDRTKDTDLDINESKFRLLCYFLLSIFIPNTI